jgi:hypothetical protein
MQLSIFFFQTKYKDLLYIEISKAMSRNSTTTGKKFYWRTLLGKGLCNQMYLDEAFFSLSKYLKFDEARASKPKFIIYCKINNDKAEAVNARSII